MDTIIGNESERDVEARLLHPLFRKILGYPERDLEWNRPVKVTFGREVKTKQADLVVNHNTSPVIAVEAKKPTESVASGVGQVDSYAFALKTPYSVITNGKHFILRGYYASNSRFNVIDDTIERLEGSNWDKLINLISFNNILSSSKDPYNPIVEPDEDQIKDYRRFFRRIHNAIRDREKLDPGNAFDELSKLLFLKAAEDEKAQSGKSSLILTPDKINEWEAMGEAKELLDRWFAKTIGELFPGVFEEHPRINLKPSTAKDVLGMMKVFHVKNGDVDVKGRAFEEFLPSQLRGKGLGQFFTPRPIVNFMTELAGISIHDTVIDFACGSGGFLIKAFEQMKSGVEQMPDGTLKRLGLNRSQMLEDIKNHQIFGIDAEPRAARTAKMNMLMWGDGKRVVRGNALDTEDFSGTPYFPGEYREDQPESGCSLILANPPFGSKETESHILRRYVLGSKIREKSSEKTEVLFVEKGLKLLRPEGKMLIVLPEGLMSGSTTEAMRDYIHNEAEIRAIVSLPDHAFVQSGVPTVNTIVLYLQKFTSEKKELLDKKSFGLTNEQVRKMIKADSDFNYQIFMGTAEFIGYEPSGRMIIEPGDKTDLELLLKDFADQSELSSPEIDLFEFAGRHYGEKSYRRKDQTIRGTKKGLKSSFIVNFNETEDRLDPPYYLFRHQAAPIIGSMKPLGDKIEASGERFKPKDDDELDAEYSLLTVSSDGKLTLAETIKGEEFTQNYKRVKSGDIVYNPSRINIGSIGVVTDDLDGHYVSPEYAVLRSKAFDPQFLVHLLRSPFYKMYIDMSSTGSIRNRLYLDDLKGLCVPDVSDVDQESVSNQIALAESETGTALHTATEAKSKTIDSINQLVGPDEVFRSLVDQWRRETGMDSSVARKTRHPLFGKIVAMGNKVVPLILEDIRRRPSHLFWAIAEITGENPVDQAVAGNVPKMIEAWLDWGRRRGVLA